MSDNYPAGYKEPTQLEDAYYEGRAESFKEVKRLKAQLAEANKLIKEFDEYLDRGSKDTAIYQGSKGHKELKEYLAQGGEV